jgi:hypothetical protein
MENSISYSDILQSLEALKSIGIVPQHRDTFSFMGMDVRVDENCRRPKMQLSPKIMGILDPKFAAGINAWMDEFFGAEDDVYMISGMWGPMMLLSPQSAVRITGIA